MAYIVRHKDKKSGTVYRCESYWDKEKKAPRNRQKCIGKEDPKTREIVPCRPKKPKKDALEGVSASCRMAGGARSCSNTSTGASECRKRSRSASGNFLRK